VPELVRIEDPEDERIAAYRDIRERDLVGRGGRFVAEGEVVLRVALSRSRLPLESVLLAEGREASLRDLLGTVPEGVPVYVAGQAVMDRIAGFAIHRGILAIGCARPEPAAADMLAALPPRALVVVLINLSNHDNVGGTFRNAAAFGADAVLLDASCCSPLYRKAIRVSCGMSLVVPFAQGLSATALLDAVVAAGFEPLALSPQGAETIQEVARPERAALLLGAEGSGLPREVLRRGRTVRIPIGGSVDSLNVATVSGIALHRLAGAG